MSILGTNKLIGSLKVSIKTIKAIIEIQIIDKVLKKIKLFFLEFFSI